MRRRHFVNVDAEGMPPDLLENVLKESEKKGILNGILQNVSKGDSVFSELRIGDIKGKCDTEI